MRPDQVSQGDTAPPSINGLSHHRLKRKQKRDPTAVGERMQDGDLFVGALQRRQRGSHDIRGVDWGDVRKVFYSGEINNLCRISTGHGFDSDLRLQEC